MWEGTDFQDFKAAELASGVERRSYLPEEGETWKDVMRRAEDFIADTANRLMPISPNRRTTVNSKPAKILVVTHGGFISEFRNAINLMQNKPVEDLWLANTAVSKIRFTRGRQGKLVPKVLLLNDDSHL